jgi:hypothetical protein
MRTFRTVLEQKIWERRQTYEEFAEVAEVFAREHGEVGTLGVRHLQRLASGRGPGGRPLGPVRPATARLLERIFDMSIDELLAPPGTQRKRAVQRVELASWVPSAARRKVGERLETLDAGAVSDQGARLRLVERSRLAGALSAYYGAAGMLYAPSVEGRTVLTSVLCRTDWLDAAPLGPNTDRLRLADAELDCVGRIGRVGAEGHAVDRLAEAALLGVRITNKPFYRLLDIDIRDGVVSGSVRLAPFGVYALTMDLLERELAEALASGRPRGRGELTLRDQYLPDVASVLNLQGRLCAGGVASLCAIARPADAYRGEADYALLIQERSGQVLNAAGRLAVIPKGFHEPLHDIRADARIGATLYRELEEELFGRTEVDSTAGSLRVAAPMHPNRLSAPMRWLMAVPGRLRTECTGFGLNLVSGNYEFACLVVVEDEEFWLRFGGDIEANWESAGLRVYSSLDNRLLTNLIADQSWSNEGLFAFLQGLRRLAGIGGSRVNAPTITLPRLRASAR